MKRFEANYLIHTNVEDLELVDADTKSLKVLQMKKVSSDKLSTSMFKIKLSFRATDNAEALRMAAINTDQSLLVFKDDSEMINYHIELVEKRWLKNKVLEDQFFLYKSLSA